MAKFLKGSKQHRVEAEQAAYREGCLFPVLLASALLSDTRRSLFIKKIHKLASQDLEHYELLYAPLIDQFVEFVQVLPASVGGRLGGLMDYGLCRGLLVLEECITQQEIKEDPRLTYAAFSAAMLYDVHRVLTQQLLYITEATGKACEQWQPFSGSLVGQAEYYKFRFLTSEYQKIARTVTPLLAKQLLPEAGFLWLAEDQNVLLMWLAFLSGDEEDGRLLKFPLSLIDEKLAKLMESLSPIELELAEPLEVEWGERFLTWLKEGLADGSIAHNRHDAAVFIVEEGVFVDTELFQIFCKTYSGSPYWVVVAKQFNYLGITSKGGGDFKFTQYFSSYPHMAASKVGFMGNKATDAHATRNHYTGLIITKPELVLATANVTVDSHLSPAEKVSTVKTLPTTLQSKQATSKQSFSMSK